MAGYHLADIGRGVYGCISKVVEEAHEAQDADAQGSRVMVLVELSDILGAIQGYLEKNYGDRITLEDLAHMTRLTRRAFESGERSAKALAGVVSHQSKHINWHNISQAVRYYTDRGYQYVEVPWLVSRESLDVTRPPKAKPFCTFAGELVASGEQSFIEIRQGLRQGRKYQCVTPCFRDEPRHDDLHLQTFIKVELIYVLHRSARKIEPFVEEVLADARNFFSNYGQVDSEETDIGTDLVMKGIEVGSYGYREHDGFCWVYGTGCAEPRLSQVVGNFGNDKV